VTSEEDIREIARSLPGSFERESYGGCPSWRTSPRMFAWIRDDPEALVVWVESPEAKDALLATDPGKFFTTSHYDGQWPKRGLAFADGDRPFSAHLLETLQPVIVGRGHPQLAEHSGRPGQTVLGARPSP